MAGAGLRSPDSIGLHNAMIDGGSIHGRFGG